MSERTTKSIRITEDAQRLLRLVAAFENRTEGAIVEDAPAAYLRHSRGECASGGTTGC